MEVSFNGKHRKWEYKKILMSFLMVLILFTGAVSAVSLNINILYK
jgi:CHASE3 domain sensor protein